MTMYPEKPDYAKTHWLWRYMTDEEFDVMNDEMEKHCRPLAGGSEEQYYMIKAIEKEHTETARKRLGKETFRKLSRHIAKGK